MRWFVRRFLTVLLAVTFYAVGTTISPSVSSAEDVWFYSDDAWSCYLDTNRIRKNDTVPQYTVLVKKVMSNGKYQGDFENLGFTIDGLDCYVYDRMSGKWMYVGRVGNDAYCSAAWQAMQPYL